MDNRFYLNHLKSSSDLVTTYEDTRAGFVALALEKNRRATPYVTEARVLLEAASKAKTPIDLLKIKDIEVGLLTAAGLSDKSLVHLLPEDKAEAINGLIKNFLEPAGTKFVEELVFRFLLTHGIRLMPLCVVLGRWYLLSSIVKRILEGYCRIWTGAGEIVKGFSGRADC